MLELIKKNKFATIAIAVVVIIAIYYFYQKWQS
jgi:hypothetical protein